MVPITTPKRSSPEVVVFDASSLTKSTAKTASKAQYKSFMSAKITKINAKPPKISKEVQKEEQESRQNDRELNDLLEGKLMIEKLHESQLTGKDRHNHNTQKLMKLGMKIKTKSNLPADQFFNAQRNREKRAADSIKDAKDRGVLNATVKRELEVKYLGKAQETERRKPKLKMGDRGLRIGEGKFKDGVLHISKSHIDRVNGSGKTPGRVGKSKGSKGKSKGKNNAGGNKHGRKRR